jgi:hypothetical protein
MVHETINRLCSGHIHMLVHVSVVVVPTLGGGYGNGALRHPGALGRGVGGHQAGSVKPPLGIIVNTSDFFHCQGTCFLEWRQ